MSKPDYPALSAKLMRQSQQLCDKCGLTVLRDQNQSKPCDDGCPSLVILHNATSILKNMR